MQKRIRCPSKFGTWLKNAIRENGITQTELAKRLGTHKSVICLYINYNVFPQKDTLDKILNILGYDIEFVKK